MNHQNGGSVDKNKTIKPGGGPANCNNNKKTDMLAKNIQKYSSKELYAASILAITLGRAHDFIGSLLIGSHALKEDGSPITRETKDGKSYYVKEPALIQEIVGIVLGGTTLRDEAGNPVTDETGKLVKEPGILKEALIKLFSKGNG